MGRKIIHFIKYTKKELDNYVDDTNSCVQKINTIFHTELPPWGLSNIKETLTKIIGKKIGSYDTKLKGIILDIKNLKIIGDLWPLRSDNPELHLDINADFYIFKPIVNNHIEGIVKHVTPHNISVIIYRVFNVAIRISQMEKAKKQVAINQKITIRIKKFDLQNVIPYIEAELIQIEKVVDDHIDKCDSGISVEEIPIKLNTKIHFNDNENDLAGNEIEHVSIIKSENNVHESFTKANVSDSDSDDEVSNMGNCIRSNIKKEKSDSSDTSDDDTIVKHNSVKSNITKRIKKEKELMALFNTTEFKKNTSPGLNRIKRERMSSNTSSPSTDDDNLDTTKNYSKFINSKIKKEKNNIAVKRRRSSSSKSSSASEKTSKKPIAKKFKNNVIMKRKLTFDNGNLSSAESSPAKRSNEKQHIKVSTEKFEKVKKKQNSSLKKSLTVDDGGLDLNKSIMSLLEDAMANCSKRK